jgi:hypothetical protein
MDTSAGVEECSVEGLDLFTRPLVQTAIRSSEWVMYKPITSLKDATVTKVLYNSQPGVTLDLARTVLKFDCKITKADGTALTNADNPKVGPVNYLAAAAWQQVDVELNGRNVTSSNSNYAYRGYLEVLTSYGTGARSTWLRASGWNENTSVPVSRTKAEAIDGGMEARIKDFQTSQTVTIVGALHLDLFQQNRHLLPNVNVLLTLIRNSNEFIVQCATDDATKYKFDITDLNVYFLQNKLSDSENLRIERQLQTMPALYPITRVDIRTFTIAKGLSAFSEENAFMGQLPRRIMLGIVADSAYTGSHHTSPFNFDCMKMNYLSLSVGGRQIPSLPMTPRSGAPASLTTSNDEYLWFMAGLGKLFANDDIAITPENWESKGNKVFAFDIQPHMTDDCVGHMERGNVRINMRFAEAVSDTSTLIVLAEFNNTIIIDRNRNVIHDF